MWKRKTLKNMWWKSKKIFPFCFGSESEWTLKHIESRKLMCIAVREKHLKGKMFIKQYQTVLLDETQFLDSSKSCSFSHFATWTWKMQENMDEFMGKMNF